MNDLDILRRKIDKIDKEMLDLFLQRMGCAKEVAEYKRINNKPILDKQREATLLKERVGLLENPEYELEVREFFTSLMAISRSVQQRATAPGRFSIDYLEQESKELVNGPICYQGTVGAYQDMAVIRRFGENASRVGLATFADVFEYVSSGEAAYGVVPIENSYTGSINDVVDLLVEHKCYIVGEIFLPINHCLLGVEGAELGGIKEVYSHEQGLLQCRKFFLEHPSIKQVPCQNTAMGAKQVAEMNNKSIAAIAGEQNAQLYGLKVLLKDICMSANNTTRLIVIAKKCCITEECRKISIAFTLPHQSGALRNVLSVFANGGINLLKIQSRPTRDRNFEYMFYVDCEGNIKDPQVNNVLERVHMNTSRLWFLGNYES